MKHTYFRMALISAAVICCINWGGEETSVEGRKKGPVNFYGNLKTYNNNKQINVENITIARAYKQIPFYGVPNNIERLLQAPEGMETRANTQYYKLLEDPKCRDGLCTGTITKIDLSEVAEIKVEPEDRTKLFIYQRKPGARKILYAKVTIISKDPGRTKNSYLIETNRRLICDEVNQAGPMEKEIPLRAIEALNIEGYRLREGEQQKCPCPVESKEKKGMGKVQEVEVIEVTQK